MFSCPEAYCIESTSGKIPQDDGTKLNVSGIHPVISADTEYIKDENNALYFYCDFEPLNNTDYYYKVIWLETSNSITLTQLYQPEPANYTTQDQFRSETRLNHQQLKQLNITLNIKITCSVNARQAVHSIDSDTRLSEERFFGIEILNTTSITIDYDPAKKEEDPVYLSFRLMVPFGGKPGSNGQEAHLNMKKLDNNNGQCKVSNMVFAQKQGIPKSCGTKFTLEDYQNGTIKNIELKLITGDSTLNWNQMFFIYFQVFTMKYDPYLSELNLPLIKVTVKQNLETMRGKYCYSYNDPHFRTFDGRTYDNHVPGTYIFYKNNRDNAQVQIKTDRCGIRPACNCGIAVNLGRDVFVIDACTRRSRFDIKFKQCNDGLLRDKVKKSGSTYRVFFPSGTEVIISLWHPPWMNIRIIPSRLDFNQTTGMCGSLDNNWNNDLLNNNPLDHGASWRITNTPEDLFLDQNLITYQWPGEKLFCECKNQMNGTLLESVTCNADEAKKCAFDNSVSAFNRCSHSEGIVSRRRRGELTVEGDVHTSANTSFNASEENDNKEIVDFSQEEASAFCEEAFNIQVIEICKQVPDFDVTSAINNCAADILGTNTTEFTMATLDVVVSLCETWIEANTPPTMDETDNFVLVVNGTEYANLTDEVLQTIVNPVFTNSSLQLVKELVCPDQCLGRGICVNGTCKCNETFTDPDCSINLQEAPRMLGIPDNGLCDRVHRLCEQTSVFVSNVAENSSCVLTEIEVSIDGTVTNRTTQTVSANKLSPTEVLCSLPSSSMRRRRQTEGELLNDIVAEGYIISITNNGYHTSEGDVISIYDSDCVHCLNLGGEIKCDILTETRLCVHDSLCYEQNSEIGCFACQESNGLVSWHNICDGEVGGKCFANGSCTWDATCSISSICECGMGKSIIDGVCIHDGRVGTSCLPNSICLDSNAYCSKSDHCQTPPCMDRCICNHGFSVNGNDICEMVQEDPSIGNTVLLVAIIVPTFILLVIIAVVCCVYLKSKKTSPTDVIAPGQAANIRFSRQNTKVSILPNEEKNTRPKKHQHARESTLGNIFITDSSSSGQGSQISLWPNGEKNIRPNIPLFDRRGTIGNISETATRSTRQGSQVSLWPSGENNTKPNTPRLDRDITLGNIFVTDTHSTGQGSQMSLRPSGGTQTRPNTPSTDNASILGKIFITDTQSTEQDSLMSLFTEDDILFS
ncbi:uncharacterized protein LOC128228929 [Mya arenaria]|nr:uncharacterized protein LOC128228929 [Mya arenaria]